MKTQPKPRILVLDDEVLVALEITDVLEYAGYEVVGPHASLDAASAEAAVQDPDLAVLDINLGNGQTSLPLARSLVERDVPVVFATATDKSILGDLERKTDLVAKPFSSNDLLEAIARRLAH